MAIQPPVTRIWPITLRLKITACAMPARLAFAVGDAAPSINGVMMLLSCARMVVDALYFFGHCAPTINAVSAVTANISPSAIRRRRASLTSTGTIAANGVISSFMAVPCF